LIADNNVVTYFYWLTVINKPPFLETVPKNVSYYAGCAFFHYLPKGIDPENGPLRINVTSQLSPFITNEGGFIFMILAPGELEVPFI
jgi:hypothetical protein